MYESLFSDLIPACWGFFVNNRQMSFDCSFRVKCIRIFDLMAVKDLQAHMQTEIGRRAANNKLLTRAFSIHLMHNVNAQQIGKKYAHSL